MLIGELRLEFSRKASRLRLELPPWLYVLVAPCAAEADALERPMLEGENVAGLKHGFESR